MINSCYAWDDPIQKRLVLPKEATALLRETILELVLIRKEKQGFDMSTEVR